MKEDLLLIDIEYMSAEDFSGGTEVQSNWMKFLKVGDGIKGTLIGKRLQPSNTPGFQDQWVYELKKADGNIWNVGVSVAKQGTIQRLNNCKLGEIIGILFEKEGEPSKKGFAPAKFLKVVTFGVDPHYNEMEGGTDVEDIEM